MNLAMPSIAIKKGMCQILALNKFSVQQWLKTFDTVIFDADGVLWHQDVPVKEAPETFNALRAMGKNALICTNMSVFSRRTVWNKAQRLGFLVNEDEVLTSTMTLARYLSERKFKRKIFVLGEQGLVDELIAAGLDTVPLEQDEKMLAPTLRDHAHLMHLDPDVGAVAVGLDTKFNMLKMTKACCYLNNPKVLFLATNKDRCFPAGNGRLAPAAGVIIAAVQAATKRRPFVCGKPNTYMCLHLIREGVIKPERTLMVGDTLYTDIQFGYNCGFQTLLVGTGVSSLKDVEAAQKSKHPLLYQQIPDQYIPKISDLLKFLPSRNG